MKKIICSPKAPKAVGPYSQAVEVNGTLYVSGSLGIDPSSGQMSSGVKEQTVQAMENLKAILGEAGYSFTDVVKCTCLLKDMADFKEFNEIYGSYFPHDPPARITYAAAGLPLGGMVEVDCIAVK